MAEIPANPPAPSRMGLRLSRRNWLIVATAFAIGLLLFLLLWLDHRSDDEFYRAAAPVAGPGGQVFEPLPVPMQAGEETAPTGGDRASGTVGIDETRPAAPPPPAPAPAPTPPPKPAPAPVQVASSDPVLLGKPSAPYPIRALRDRESGTVMLRVVVGADGVPGDVDVARSSGSRILDRAAMGAVKSWRFKPAMRNGQAEAATVQIPVAYNLDER